MKRYLIGLDIGSSFIKAMLFDTAGRALASGKQDNHKVLFSLVMLSVIWNTIFRDLGLDGQRTSG